MWHREDAEWCGPGWGYTPRVDSNTEELNSKLAEANVKFRHQNAELVGANFKLRNQNVQLRRWCNHLGSVVASQKQRIKSIQADLEEVRTERDNLLAAGRHFDAILHRGMVCTAPPAPRAEFVPRPATTLNMSIPNNGGEVDRTVSGVWLDGFLSPLTNCDPTTRSPFAEYTPEEKEELKRYLLTQRGPASARGGGRGKALLTTGSHETLQKANGPSTSIESSSRSSDSPQEASVPTANTSTLVTRLGTGSPTWVLTAEVAPVCPEERMPMPSAETRGKCIRAPYEGNMDEGPSASLPEENVGPDLPEETLWMSSTEPSEKWSKTLAGNGNDSTTTSLDEVQVPECPFMPGNLGEESSKQGDNFSGGAGPCSKTDDDCIEEGTRTETSEPGDLVEECSRLHGDLSGGAGPGDETDDCLEEGARTETDEPGDIVDECSKQGHGLSGGTDLGGETDDDCLEEGATTETDEPGSTEHESETHRVGWGENPPGISSSDEDCRSKRSTEEKPEASSPQQLNAQISGDETDILDGRNSKPLSVSEARDTQNEELIVGSGSAADPLKINEPEAVDPCDVLTDFADPRGPEVITSRSACPAEEETSKYAQGELKSSASRASSAWSSHYSHKLYSCNPTHGSDSCGSQGSGASGGNDTSVEDEISSDRYTHVTHCCWCFNERLESQAVALCEGCPRIMCRQCLLNVGLRVPSGDNSRDSILPASSCRCLKFDSEFRKPPPNAQPEAHLLEELWRHDLSLQFREPVDTESNPNYLSVITKEKMMDLATLAEKMKNRCYQTPRGQRKFLLDIRQIWSNCWKYAQYDPNDQSPVPGIVSCTRILANMVDEYCKSNMKVLTLTLDEESWLASRESLKQTKFCEMVKGNPRYMAPAVNMRNGAVEENQMDDGLTKRMLPSSRGSTSVKRKFSSLAIAEDNSSDPEEVVSGTLFNLADVGDRLIQEAKRRRGTRNES